MNQTPTCYFRSTRADRTRTLFSTISQEPKPKRTCRLRTEQNRTPAIKVLSHL